MPIPSFEDLLQPTLDSLRQLGGLQTIAAINRGVSSSLALTSGELAHPHGDSKQTELEYRLAWARTYLKHFGLIDNPKRGMWTLTEQGQKTEHVNPREVSSFVQERIKQGKLGEEQLDDEIAVQTTLDVSQRLLQWRAEATDPIHPNYAHADLDHAIRLHGTISGLLRKLRTMPGEFGRDDVVALFGALNSGQRMKNKVADENPLPLLRETLLALVDGAGPAVEKIAAAAQTLKFAGANTLGELYGWANAETAPLYNGCATAALHYLGYAFDDRDYQAFIAAHEQFKQLYRQEVGHLRPELPHNLEIDKLYNVIDKVDLKENNRRPLAKPFNDKQADDAADELGALIENPDNHDLEIIAPSAPFTSRTFELLEGLHATPTKAYYQTHKDGFKQFIEDPFQRVFRQVAQQLPPAVRAAMETEKGVFARILKNDWGQGGAWSFYWGAFYPKGGKRTEDAQLSMWIDYRLLEHGFYIGDYAGTQRERFQRNCQTFGPALLPYLREALPETVVRFADREHFDVSSDGAIVVQTPLTWEDFLRDPAQVKNDISIILPRQQLLALSEEQLVAQIAESYRKLFPLVLLATEDDPLSAIERYQRAVGLLIDDMDVEPPAPYARHDFLAQTYLREDQADDLYDMLLDKKQLILYGPPGTGKTYVAQALAKWLTGLAEPPAERLEMVQFHPAYSYEDFIEGIRPESRRMDDGRFMVDYPPRAGVFRRFCKIAQANPDQPHVFIIDEINRGNIPRIFGELMLLLEYRERDVPLPYSGERFRIPPNVYLIGTMNTADRSIALVDFALRRRFHFFHFLADPDLLERWLAQHPVPIPYLAALYRHLSQEAIEDRDYAVGVSYFMDPDLTEAKLARIWQYSILPYLIEYHVEQRAKVKNWEWDSEFMRGIRGEL